MEEVKRIIREARIDDAKNLLAFLQKVGSESDNLTFDAKGLPFSEEQEREYLDSRMCSHNNITLLALEGENIIGSLGVDTPSFERLSHRGEMGISVLQQCWGQGVGSALLEAMLAWIHGGDTGLRKIDLTVREDNVRALALYRKFGFQQEGKVSRLVAIGTTFYDGITMGLALD
ncbi:MAG: GNAT family N-acetyltransferase [Spirochaetia bacterium]|nr:GNAT family N-acetyltransferase [Spirochaetia bacterium]